MCRTTSKGAVTVPVCWGLKSPSPVLKENLWWNSWRSGDLKQCFRLRHKGLMTDLSCLFNHLLPQAKGQRVSILTIMRYKGRSPA